MPGALIFGHHLRDLARLIDHVVAGHFALGPRQPVDRLRAALQARVVQKQHVRLADAAPRLEIRRGMQGADQRAIGLGDQSPRSLAMVSYAALMAASLRLAISR